MQVRQDRLATIDRGQQSARLARVDVMTLVMIISCDADG